MEAPKKRLQILLLEKQRLTLELARLKKLNETGENESSAKDPKSAVFVLQEEVNGTKDALASILEDLSAGRKELVREKDLLAETKIIESSLRQTVKTLESKGSEVQHLSLLDEKREELSRVRKLTSKGMKRLLQFLDKYHPPITVLNGDHPPTSKRSRGHSQSTRSTTFSLKDIIEDLMNLSVSNPDQPYLTLESGEFHEPHIHLLLMAGIITYHPTNSTQIKLVGFHS
ncbi:centromere protein Cenp-K [Dimargaris cristalligena]|uniref:Centromere protein Cenp-K n=1 Tax=Dimargaris cristalligena TaxID=215637 RepID=A0A4P9ZMW9_9FUNG|nr:centromere protein Cenp-K [Dimargaris cristalligena]|eukprot:RKP34438.1 centromere protein Cenp-K [Dimargaris cristalligena]